MCYDYTSGVSADAEQVQYKALMMVRPAEVKTREGSPNRQINPIGKILHLKHRRGPRK